VKDDNWIHVIPKDDIKEHELSFICPCRPDIEWQDNIVTHNAFDKREAVEQAEQILKPSNTSKK